ncbi:MAG: hypothetical protein QXJ75_00880 [Candidatus Bathyarchaeia archaeon]
MSYVHEGDEVDFEIVKEEWSEYKLKDGATLKVKPILLGVLRTNQHDPLGNPVYIVSSQNAIRVVNVPFELKKRPRGQQVV